MIFLKKLKMQGFKSFANKTVFDFNHSITAIVGPNGSGKSNVMDALRWVLGERGIKNLRGDKIEDLIFAGTSKKNPASLARVELSFDNSNKIFPLDYDEVVISRRVDRSGVSEFYLNDQPIRLRDLILYFSQAKIGSQGMMLVRQGESDMFVSINPVERRLLIEEILGLKTYRLKKEQTENQLENSLINMEKLQAMINEIKPHLRFFRHQKNQWQKRNEIEQELHQIENEFFAHKYFSLQKEL
ncbi:MAG: AAA family ATPase, partial [Minisyncoccia bacterium]